MCVHFPSIPTYLQGNGEKGMGEKEVGELFFSSGLATLSNTHTHKVIECGGVTLVPPLLCFFFITLLCWERELYLVNALYYLSVWENGFFVAPVLRGLFKSNCKWCRLCYHLMVSGWYFYGTSWEENIFSYWWTVCFRKNAWSLIFFLSFSCFDPAWFSTLPIKFAEKQTKKEWDKQNNYFWTDNYIFHKIFSLFVFAHTFTHTHKLHFLMFCLSISSKLQIKLRLELNAQKKLIPSCSKNLGTSLLDMKKQNSLIDRIWRGWHRKISTFSLWKKNRKRRQGKRCYQ